MSKKLPPEVIDTWPEVFGDIDVKSVPVEYLVAIHVKFRNNDTWIIDMKKNQPITPNTVDKQLNELFTEYQDEIVKVDFKVDTAKVKKDVQKRTNLFIKKRK